MKHPLRLRLLTWTLMLAGLAASALPAHAASDQYKEDVVQQTHQAPQADQAAGRAIFGTDLDLRAGHGVVVATGTAGTSTSVFATASPAQQRRGNALGGVSLGLGILSIVLLFIPVIGFGSILFAVAAIVLGAIGIGRDDRPGMAIAGLILGIFVVVLYILALALIASLL